MATTRYNLGLQLAEVQATKVTGGFTGMRQELGAVQDAFRSAESLAREMGASERTLVEIRRESINQQLSLFNNLLSQQPEIYPIYDSYVEKLLLHFKKKDKFSHFKKEELKKYKKFLEVIQTFKQYYNLDNFSLRQIDIYLWLAGKEYFPNKY